MCMSPPLLERHGLGGSGISGALALRAQFQVSDGIHGAQHYAAHTLPVEVNAIIRGSCQVRVLVTCPATSSRATPFEPVGISFTFQT